MYILSTLEDLIQIEPQEFDKPSAQAIKDSVNTKYANKVIQKVGLCVCMYDLLEASEGLIGHGTGLVNVNVTFRMLVYRPFRGEIIQGKIKESDETGIIIDLDFTAEAFVPGPSFLPENSQFDRAENTWIWHSEGSELYFDKGEPVYLRVEEEQWKDQEPTVVRKDDAGEIIDTRSSPYTVLCSMGQAGLGPTIWWNEEAAEEDEEGVEAMEE